MSLTQSKCRYASDRDLSHQQGNLGAKLKLVLYAYFIMFAASLMYANSLAALLGLAKWLPFLILPLICLQFGQFRINRDALLLLAGAVVAAIFSFIASPYGFASYPELLSFFILLGSALLLSEVLRRRQAMDQVFSIIMNIGRYIIAISFIMAMMNINLGRGAPRFSGWSDNPNSLGLIIAPAIIILFARVLEKRHRWKTRYLPFLFAGLVVLALTGSRGSIGWVLVSCLVFPIMKMRLVYQTLILIFGVVLIVPFSETLLSGLAKVLSRENINANVANFDAMLSGRTEAWVIGLNSIAEHPLLGLGIGNETRLLRDHAPDLLNHHGENLHSSYLSILVQIGFLGGAFVGTMFLLAILRGLRTVRIQRHRQERNRPTTVLPLALMLGAFAHAAVETWLLNAGNANSLLFWVLVFYSISVTAAGAGRLGPLIHELSR